MEQMFEYVCNDLPAGTANKAIEIASNRAWAAGFTIVSVKRVTDKRAGSLIKFSVVLNVRQRESV